MNWIAIRILIDLAWNWAIEQEQQNRLEKDLQNENLDAFNFFYNNFESTMQKQQEINKVQGSDDEGNEGNQSNKKLSKHQKKKLKEQRKKQQQKKKQLESQGVSVKVEELKQEDQPKKQEVAEKKEQVKQEKKEQKKKQQKKDDKKKKGGKVNAIAKLAQQRMQDLKKFEEEQQRKRKQQQEEKERLRKEEQERKRKEQQEKQRIIKEKQREKQQQKDKGLYLNKKQKRKMEIAKLQIQQGNKLKEKQQNQEKGEEKIKTQEQIKKEQEKRQKMKKKEDKLLKDKKADFQLMQDKYRSPVCCILGHVDTGKTTLLDKIRRTNVQEGEAGGITQQIGATFFPKAKLVEEISKCKSILDIEVLVPGLLIIDTPGHESFSNLRSRGSSLCDIAILVIDLQHGLQNQTLESLELLKKGGTPFVVALNKIDRSYGWEAFKDSCSYQSLKKQNQQAFHDYRTKLDKVILQLNQKGYNAALYWQNQDPDEYISLIPTSGITGQGIPDLLTNIVNNCLTNEVISQRIQIKKDKFKCTVMQVKMIEGYGTTIDCLLIDGAISKEDEIVLLGFNGPIVTKVKALLTPHPMKQMRVKDQYIHHDTIYAANGVKIAANGLDAAVAGSPLIVCSSEEEVQQAKAICRQEFSTIQKKFKLESLGVGVSASTLGSLEALLQYLKSQKIPVSHISVGPVSKQDVIKAMKSMLSEVPERRKQQYACLLVFDVKVLADAQKYAQENGIKIFTANIIYHLTEFFTKHVAAVKQQRKQRQGKQAVFPCVLKQVATFRKSDPIVLGVDVEAGVLRIGTPICIYNQKQKNGDKQIRIGVVQSIQHNHKKLTEARKKNGSVAISLGGDPSVMSGRHFDPKDVLCSMITRRSIDCLKQHFKADMTNDDWKVVIELKNYFNVQ